MDPTTASLGIPSIVPTIAKTIAQPASEPTLSPSDCASLDGTPLLPASDSAFRCGTKTSNRTLVESCCNGLAVQDYLGCFTYCSIGPEFNHTFMGELIDCLESNVPTNESAIDLQFNAFCQGNLSSTVQAQRSSSSPRLHKISSPFLLTLFLTLTFLFTTTTACTFSISENSTLIRQGEGRRLPGAGFLCGGTRPCIVSMSGPSPILSENRTINGEDASGNQYDSFFEVAGQATNPPRLFPARVEFDVRQWGLGRKGATAFPVWTPLSYCVFGTASACDEVDGFVEACGALFQSGTGLEDNPVPQGLFLRYAF